MGDMSGATNMAPMITAVELDNKPKVAMVQERMINRKKSYPGDAESINSFRTSSFLSAGSG
jgi:hypothetical protein